jgi:hypothetical protein
MNSHSVLASSRGEMVYLGLTTLGGHRVLSLNFDKVQLTDAELDEALAIAADDDQVTVVAVQTKEL